MDRPCSVPFQPGDFAYRAAEAVARGECDRALLFCKSGIGMEMAANKVEGVRAANCPTVELARLSRAHNDANALSLPSSYLLPEEMEEIVRSWLETVFEGGRHARRVEKLVLKPDIHGSRGGNRG